LRSSYTRIYRRCTKAQTLLAWITGHICEQTRSEWGTSGNFNRIKSRKKKKKRKRKKKDQSHCLGDGDVTISRDWQIGTTRLRYTTRPHHTRFKYVQLSRTYRVVGAADHLTVSADFSDHFGGFFFIFLQSSITEKSTKNKNVRAIHSSLWVMTGFGFGRCNGVALLCIFASEKKVFDSADGILAAYTLFSKKRIMTRPILMR